MMLENVKFLSQPFLLLTFLVAFINLNWLESNVECNRDLNLNLAVQNDKEFFSEISIVKHH